MLTKISFPPNIILPSKELPCTLISLEEWTLVIINGADTNKYLQGQFTCDITALNKNQYNFSAYCNAKGKMIGSMYVFYFQDGIAFIQRHNVCDKQILEMKKYAQFFKINITTNNNIVLIGVAGFKARNMLSSLFNVLPDEKNNIIHYQNITLLHFNLPTERFLLLINKTIQNDFLKQIQGKTQINNSKQWVALDIESGYPLITITTSERFVPQAANMHLLSGISFNKGCYLGQEIISRTQHRGINKRSLYRLTGASENTPTTGNSLEIKIHDRWQKAGIILESCQLKNKTLWIQAILNDYPAHDSIFRIANDKNENIFTIY